MPQQLLGVRSWRYIKSGGTRTKEAEFYWSRWWCCKHRMLLLWNWSRLSRVQRHCTFSLVTKPVVCHLSDGQTVSRFDILPSLVDHETSQRIWKVETKWRSKRERNPLVSTSEGIWWFGPSPETKDRRISEDAGMGELGCRQEYINT